MARPPKTVDIPFDLLFPLLVYYYAQLRDRTTGGEWSTNLSWDGLCQEISASKPITLSYEQLESLLYSYRAGVMDRARPFKVMGYMAKNYRPLMEKLLYFCPDLFKEEKDGEIVMIGPADYGS